MARLNTYFVYDRDDLALINYFMLIFLKANKTKQSFVKILRTNQILKSIGSSTKANYDNRCCQTHKSFQCVPPQQTGHHPNQIDAAPLVIKKNQARTGRSQHTSPGSADSTQGTLPTQQFGRKQGARGRPIAQAPTLRAHAQSEDIVFAHARRGRASRVSFHPLLVLAGRIVGLNAPSNHRRFWKPWLLT